MEKNKIFSNLFWKFAERIGAKGVSLIVSIILARIIAPEEYGLIALITIFITILNVFVESGLGTALVQKKNADSKDFSSVFYCNVVFSILMYIILFFIAPFIAKFYNNSRLIPIIRVAGITLLIAGLKGVQNAYVSKNMIFKKFFIATIIGTILSAFIGVGMAMKGYGVWALVAQQLSNNAIDTIMLWLIVDWRPTFEFSFTRLKKLFNFGWKMLSSSLLDTIYNELYGLTIGKVFNPETLAYYNKGNQFPQLLAINIDGSIQSVMLPTLSQEQDNKEKVKTIMRRSIKTSSYLLFPMMFGLAAVSQAVVSIILTDKWLPCVLIMQMLCFSYALYPIHTVNLQAISAMGRSDIFLKLEIVKKIQGIILLIMSLPFGVYVMAGTKILGSIIATFINSYPNKKLLNYSFKEQIADIFPNFIIAIMMFMAVIIVNYIEVNVYVKLLLQMMVGIFIYLFLSVFTKNETFLYIAKLIKNKLKSKNSKA